jgi:4-carboxymuconolactone decarboxylase
MTDRYDKGMQIRRKTLGDAHVDRAEAARSTFDAPFQQMITEGAWGTVWAGDGLTPRDRSLVTLALLAGGGNWEELAMHVRATANTGATPQEVREALMHVAVYAGVPRANHAFRIVKQTYRDMGVEV